MSRPWILASVLALAVAALSTTPAKAVKPQPPPPPPTITAIVLGPARFSLDRLDGAIWATASDGKIYAALAPSFDVPLGPFQEVGKVPGRPVSITHENYYLTVCLENGDVYRQARTIELPPYTFNLVENVFTSAGAPPTQSSQLAQQSGDLAPSTFLENALGRTVPNPSRGTAMLEYSTRTAGKVRVRIFDASGRLVRTLQAEHGAAGKYGLSWDGSTDSGEHAGSGAFYYRVTFPDGSETARSLVRLR